MIRTNMQLFISHAHLSAPMNAHIHTMHTTHIPTIAQGLFLNVLTVRSACVLHSPVRPGDTGRTGLQPA